MTTREAIVAEARSYLGTPFVHQGRLRHIGIDCIGLVGGTALSEDIPEAREWMASPEYHNYSREPDPRVMLRGCDRFMDRIPVSEVNLGDVLIIKFAVEPMHFAIVTALNPMYVIHALSTVGKVVEHRFDQVWTNRIVRAYRFRGL